MVVSLCHWHPWKKKHGSTGPIHERGATQNKNCTSEEITPAADCLSHLERGNHRLTVWRLSGNNACKANTGDKITPSADA